MNVHIAQVNKVLFDGSADSITVPASDGEMTILPHHEPFISTLEKGNILVKAGDKTETFEILRGILEINANECTIIL